MIRFAPHPPLWCVVEESFDEAEFLWRSWEMGLHASARNLHQTWFWIEDRLHGALDGVRLGGQPIVEELLLPGLASSHTSVVQVAAHVLAQIPGGGQAALRNQLCGAQGLRRGLFQRSLELLTTPAQTAALHDLLSPLGAAALPWLVACRSFRRERSSAEAIAGLAASEVSDERAVAMQGTRLLPRHLARPLIESGLADHDISVVAAAAESGLIHRLPAAWRRCGQLATSEVGTGALFWLATLGDRQEQKLLMAALGGRDTFTSALQALGFLGTREAADVALETMQAQSETNLRLAAEAFCAVTGLDLAAERLIAAEPLLPEEPVSFELDNLQANLVPTPDQLLPLPDVRGVARWWQQHRQRFASDARYIAGQPLSPHALLEALLHAPMRRRHVWAFELAVRTGGSCDVQTRGFSNLQKQQLAQARLLLTNDATPFLRGRAHA